MSTIPSQRGLFDIPSDVAYLNCAYMSPLMKPVVAAGEAAVQHKARPWQIQSGDFFSLPERFKPLELHFGVLDLVSQGGSPGARREDWYISYLDSDTV